MRNRASITLTSRFKRCSASRSGPRFGGPERAGLRLVNVVSRRACRFRMNEVSATKEGLMRFVVVMLLISGAGTPAGHLHPDTAAAWTAYVSATESRIGRELSSPRGFLAIDYVQDAVEKRRTVLSGAV